MHLKLGLPCCGVFRNSGIFRMRYKKACAGKKVRDFRTNRMAPGLPPLLRSFRSRIFYNVPLSQIAHVQEEGNSFAESISCAEEYSGMFPAKVFCKGIIMQIGTILSAFRKREGVGIITFRIPTCVISPVQNTFAGNIPGGYSVREMYFAKLFPISFTYAILMQKQTAKEQEIKAMTESRKGKRQKAKTKSKIKKHKTEGQNNKPKQQAKAKSGNKGGNQW